MDAEFRAAVEKLMTEHDGALRRLAESERIDHERFEQGLDSEYGWPTSPDVKLEATIETEVEKVEPEFNEWGIKMRKIKLTREGIGRIQLEAGWTPYVFLTEHGYVTIPGPPDDDDYFDYSDDWLSCGCCSCCGCRCEEMNEYSYMYYDEEEPE